MKRFVSGLIICFILATATVAQEKVKQGGNDVAAPRPSIPRKMSDGRAVIATGVYQSQIVGVVPKDYRPVSVDRLSAAIQAKNDSETSNEDTLLKSSFYDVKLVGHLLTSDHSSIDLQFANASSTFHRLGKANLALTSERVPAYWATSDPDFGNQARMESGTDGVLYANIPLSDARNSEATIDFAWELTGRQDGIYQSFDLNIPRTAQTRIVLSAPTDVIPETTDGVLRSLPGPPPGADIDSRRDDVRWHTIDAGGLDQIRLRFRPRIDEDQSTPTLVRSQTLQYEIRPTGLNWIHTLTFQAPGGRTLPKFHVDSANVTSISIDGVRVGFDQATKGNGVNSIVVGPPLNGPPSIVKSSVVSIAGTAPLTQSEGWSDLPFLTWEDKSVIVSHRSSEAQLSVLDPLFLVSWDLPALWTRQKTKNASIDGRETSKVVLASGPPIVAKDIERDAPDAIASGQRFENANMPSHWSKVRLARRPSLTPKGIQTQFRIDENASEGSRLVSAKARLQLALDPNQTAPVQLQLEPFWNLNKITFVHSGRVIEASSIKQGSRTVTLWPEREDLADALLTIQCDGYRRLRGSQQSLKLPEMWFVRFQNLRAETTMAIVPPDNLNWTGAVELTELRWTADSLSDEDLQFFDGITDDTVIYRPKTDTTPELWLEKPGVLIDVRASLRFQWVDEKVHESLVIDADTTSQLVKELSIRMATGTGKESVPLQTYRWSLESTSSGIAINLPSTAVSIDQPGQYTIDLGETSLRNRKLIGRREYELTQPLRIQLPNVVGTASQESEVIVGEGLQLDRLDTSVQRVPLVTKVTSGKSSAGDATPTRIAAVRLRYDAAKKPWIELSRSLSDPNIDVVWQQDIELTASSRGADSILGNFLVSTNKEIKIVYEHDLRLVSLTQNGIPIDLATVPERPIVLPTQKQTDRVQAVWSRESIQRGWWRQCRIPYIQMNGVQIKPTYRLKESSDTFALASLNTRDSDDQGNGIDVVASSSRLLVHLDHAIATGWLMALILFSVSWACAQKRLLTLAALIAIAAVSAMLWRPWHAAIVGWIILPMVAAALLETTRKWNQSNRRDANTDDSPRTSGDSTEFSLVQDLPGDSRHSLGASMFAVLGLGLAFATSSSVVHAQMPTQSPIKQNAKNSDVHVLIPIDKESKPVGDKVYVSGSLYQELFDNGETQTLNDVTFLSGSYELELGGASDSGNDGTKTAITAQFAIRVRGESSFSRLPFAIDTLRRIEVRNDETDRIVRFSADGRDAVLAALPQGEQFLLKVSFIPEAKTNGNVTNLQLPIPSIAASRVTIESDRSIADVRVDGARGSTVEDRALRRWSANLGPINVLRVRYTNGENTDQNLAATISRRFLIRVGQSMTHVDGQVELSRDIAVGEDFQLIVVSPRVPSLTSPAWRLVSSESISSTRYRLRIRKMTDVNAPIQLLWSFPTIINDATSLQDREAMPLPDVLSTTTDEHQPAWIAIDHAPELRLTLDDEGAATGLTTEQFYSQWMGYRDSRPPARAFVAEGEVPSIVVLQSRPVEHTATLSQHLHLKSQQALIEFRAKISSNDTVVQGRSLRVPRNIDITRLTVDGVLIDQPAKPYSKYFEFPLGEFAGVEDALIEAVGSMRIPKSKLFTVPRIRLWPTTITTDQQYVVTRERTVRASVVRSPEEAIEVNVPEAQHTKFLSAGQVVVANWKLEDRDANASPPPLVGRLRVSARPEKFGCEQLIKMNYQDGRWNMSSEISFDDGSIPDFIDLEIPVRWCENLSVSPKTRWTETVSANPSLQLVRIACDQAALSEQKLTVRSELYSNDLGRVSVPQIEVLAMGERRVEFSLPNRLTSEPIAWETRAVSPIETSAGRSTFRAESNKWSVELASLSEVKSDPIALSVDSRVFPQANSVIVVTRWDIVPNGLDSVLATLPANAKCLGAWAAGTAVAIQQDEEFVDDLLQTSGRSSIRIPLALSRLTQSIEILTEVSIAVARQGRYLPTLQNIVEPSHWAATFSPSVKSRSQQNLTITKRNSTSNDNVSAEQLRSLALAFAVVNAIDQSLDTLAERPSDEVATWLLPWVSRYKNISSGSTHQASIGLAAELDDDQMEVIMAEIDERLVASNTSMDVKMLQQAWTALDQKMRSYVQRFLNADDFSQVIAREPMFDAHNFNGYQLAGVVQASPLKSPPAIQPTSRGMHVFRQVLVNLLSLAMAGGLLVLLRPFHQSIKHICEHPALWLAMIGILGMFVAPLSVSAAIIFVAATLAFIPGQSHS